MHIATALLDRLIDGLRNALDRASLPLMGLTYSVLGPFSCIYVATRIATWLDCGIVTAHFAALAGLLLFADIRIPLYRVFWTHRKRVLARAASRAERLRALEWQRRRPYR
jgi:hypothetical protein